MKRPTKRLPPADSLALRPRDAARALGISERCLWSMTQRGDVPHVRVGKLVLYPRHALVDWLDRLAKQPPVRQAHDDDDELARVVAEIDRNDALLEALEREGTPDE